MTQPLQIVGIVLAHADGARAWAQLVRSCERALTGNQAIAPLLAVIVLTGVLLIADWKLAGCIAKVWRRRHPGENTGKPAAPAHSAPTPHARPHR